MSNKSFSAFALAIFTIIIIFAGCGGQKEIAKDAESTPPVEANLISDQPTYTPGDTVNFTFTVKNNQPKDRQLFLLTPRPYYFVIYDMKGREIWRDAEETTSAGLNDFTMMAYQTKTFTASWPCSIDGGMPKLGEYKALAYIPVAENIKGFSDSLKFQIVD